MSAFGTNGFIKELLSQNYKASESSTKGIIHT